MLKFFKGASAYQLIVWGIIIAGTVVTILPPELFFFRVATKFSVQIMLAYLMLGLLFLFFNDERSMFVCFVCCIILCLFLRTRPAFFATPQASPSFSVMNCNLSLGNSAIYDTTIHAIIENNADVISMQEVTPDWHDALKANKRLNAQYPYDTIIVRMDFHGLALFSKYPFSQVNTFNYQNIPNLAGCIYHDSLKKDIYIISSHTEPPLSLSAYDRIESHLDTIAQFIKKLNKPVITLGDYQVMPWSSEVVKFRRKANLNDSRRDMLPTGDFPYDHIFYSNALQCTDFRSIGKSISDHLGIIGEYQLAPPPKDQ